MLNRIPFYAAAALAFAITLFPTGRPAGAFSGPPSKLVVHEWGTFTTVVQEDGVERYWNPLYGPTELPSFVYQSIGDFQQDCWVKCRMTLARMETPVLYFYADRETDVDVRVRFPLGKVSEWYPSAISVGEGVDWGRVKVVPGAKQKFPQDESKSHYYPARETDASPVQIRRGKEVETEKFLFYRGVGDFKLPVSVKMPDDQLRLKPRDGQTIGRLFLVENRNGCVGWRTVEKLTQEITLSRPVVDQPIENLRNEMEKALIAEGLYPKEAAAMVNTWRDAWFEEGLRVLMLLPRKTTDDLLPLTLSPAPDELVRVMVGRTEILTPEMQTTVAAALKQYSEGGKEARRAAIQAIRRYGRFADPLLRSVRVQQGVSSAVVLNFRNEAVN